MMIYINSVNKYLHLDKNKYLRFIHYSLALLEYYIYSRNIVNEYNTVKLKVINNMNQYHDIEASEKNFIEIKDGKTISWKGNLSNKLLYSPDFVVCPFTFSVWEITGDTYDHQTDASKFVAILRANQSTLEGALKYMKDGRVLVHNRDFPEQAI